MDRMFLVECDEGIEFEALSPDKKCDYAHKQSQRVDKDERWREIWKAIAWSHGSSKVDYATCPLCGSGLEVDSEYMLSAYGSAYEYASAWTWMYFCTSCSGSGTYKQLLAEARNK